MHAGTRTRTQKRSSHDVAREVLIPALPIERYVHYP